MSAFDFRITFPLRMPDSELRPRTLVMHSLGASRFGLGELSDHRTQLDLFMCQRIPQFMSAADILREAAPLGCRHRYVEPTPTEPT